MQTQPVNHRHFGWREGIKIVSFIKTTLQDLKRIHYRISRSSAKVSTTLNEELENITLTKGSTETYATLNIIGSMGINLEVSSSAASACPPVFSVPVTGSLEIEATVSNSKVSPDHIRWAIIAAPANQMPAPDTLQTSAGLGTLTQVEDGVSSVATYTAPLTAGVYYIRVTSQEDPTATLVLTVYVSMAIPTQLDYTALIQASRMLMDFTRRVS